MKEYPCPYSKPMILAKLAGMKTQTRRVVKPQPQQIQGYPEPFPKSFDSGHVWRWKYIDNGTEVGLYDADKDRTQSCHPPRGIVGDRQYWQEAFDFGGVESDGDWRVMAIRYKADLKEDYAILSIRDFKLAREWKPVKRGWRGMPAMYMLRSMSRGLDEIVDVRVERLQDITEEDAIAEGCTGYMLPYPNDDPHRPVEPRDHYNEVWDSINAKRPGCAWKDNPFAWIYKTKPISTNKEIAK